MPYNIAIFSPAANATAGGGDHTVLNQHAAEIRRLGKRVVSDIIKIGERLIDCKRLAGHGYWTTWLHQQFGWTEDTALNYVHAFEMSKSRNFRDLNIGVSTLYLLAAPGTPESARAEVLDRVEAGERLPVAAAKKIVREHKEKASSDSGLPADAEVVNVEESTARDGAASSDSDPPADAEVANVEESTARDGAADEPGEYKLPHFGVCFNDTDQQIGEFLEALGRDDRFFAALHHAPKLKKQIERHIGDLRCSSRDKGLTSTLRHALNTRRPAVKEYDLLLISKNLKARGLTPDDVALTITAKSAFAN